jgi:triosephosphate isomerase
MWGIRSLALALQADRISEQYNIPIIYSAQSTDISVIAERVKNILVFAQHIDPVSPGRGIGAVLPEAVKRCRNVTEPY